MSSLILSADLSLNSSGFTIIDIAKSAPIHYEAVTSDLNNIERLYYNYSRYLNILTSFRDIICISFEAQNQNMRFAYSAGSILPLAENVGVWKLAIYNSLNYLANLNYVLEIKADDIKYFATQDIKSDKCKMIDAVNGHHIKTIRNSVPEHSVNDIADSYHLAKMTESLLKGQTVQINNKQSKSLYDYIIYKRDIKVDI